jgi:hypothetical protein
MCKDRASKIAEATEIVIKYDQTVAANKQETKVKMNANIGARTPEVRFEGVGDTLTTLDEFEMENCRKKGDEWERF